MDIDAFRKLCERYRNKVIDNKYEILSGLGFGTFGAVFLGYERLKKRFVALKRVVVAQDDLEQVTAEIEGMEVLADSPNVVQSLGYAIGELSDQERAADPAFLSDKIFFYLVMEFGGVSLEPYLQRFGSEAYREDRDEMFWRQNEMLSIHVVKEALGGLRDAHERRIVHRDIKPANIYLGLNGAVRLGDFGVAKQLMQEEPMTGTIVGTVFYMAPEQVAGEEYGVNIDLFSMGIVLYRMLAGRMPFSNMVQIRTKQPDLAAPGIYPEMDQALSRALAKAPADRYQTAQEMINDLEDYEVGLEPVGFAELLDHFQENIRQLLSGEISSHLENPPTGAGTFSMGKPTAPPPAEEEPVTDATIVVRRPPAVPPESGPEPVSDATIIGVRPPTRPPASEPAKPEPVPEPEPEPMPFAPPEPVEEPAVDLETVPLEKPRSEAAPPIPPRPERSRAPLIAGIVAGVLVLAAAIIWLAWPDTVEMRIFCDQPATVFLNDEEVGTVPSNGPFVTTVPADRAHSVRLAYDGFEEFTAELDAGHGTPLDVTMAPVVQAPVLVVNVNLRDAVLKVDGRTVVERPEPVAGRFVWTLSDLAAGPHRVEASISDPSYQPAGARVELADGQTERIRLDLVSRPRVSIRLAVLDDRDRPVPGYTLKVNRTEARVDGGGTVAGNFLSGDRVTLEVAAEGFETWSREMTLGDENTRLAVVLTRLTLPEPEIRIPPGHFRVETSSRAYVYVNWHLCGRSPVNCRIPEGRAVRVFVFNHRRKVAWNREYPAGQVPRTINPRLRSCTRNLVIDWSPWAYFELLDHRGERVALAPAEGEPRPLTPRRVEGLACGAYTVKFFDAQQRFLDTRGAWLLPDSPAQIVITNGR